MGGGAEVTENAEVMTKRELSQLGLWPGGIKGPVERLERVGGGRVGDLVVIYTNQALQEVIFMMMWQEVFLILFIVIHLLQPLWRIILKILLQCRLLENNIIRKEKVLSFTSLSSLWELSGTPACYSTSTPPRPGGTTSIPGCSLQASPSPSC